MKDAGDISAIARFFEHDPVGWRLLEALARRSGVPCEEDPECWDVFLYVPTNTLVCPARGFLVICYDDYVIADTPVCKMAGERTLISLLQIHQPRAAQRTLQTILRSRSRDTPDSHSGCEILEVQKSAWFQDGRLEWSRNFSTRPCLIRFHNPVNYQAMLDSFRSCYWYSVMRQAISLNERSVVALQKNRNSC